MSNGSGSLQPTFQGHVNTTHDALLLFEGCLTGTLSHVPRRPHDRERNQLVRSGCVFIYEENASGIKRWTDGVPWSPSRILGNFLVYRELLKPFPPGEKKRATKRNNRKPQRPGEPYPRSSDGNGSGYSPETPSTPNLGREGSADKEIDRSLIGSLVDSYGFRDQGLVKKTMSVSVQGVQHHLVSYYKVEDVKTGRLASPSIDDRLRHLKPRYDLIHKQNFRVPLADEMEELAGTHPDGSRPSYYPPEAIERRPPVLGSQGFANQAPNPGGYYGGPVEAMNYSGAHQQPSQGSSQFSHPSASPYYQQPGSAAQIPPRNEEYGGYGTSPGYASRFEPYPTAGLPNPSRSASQPQAPSQSMPYPHSNIQRPNPSESPVEQPYGRGPYYSSAGLPAPQIQNYDPARRHTQPSPGSTTTRDSQSHPSGGYQNPNERQVWMNGAVPVGQGQYSGSPPVSAPWSSSMA